MNWQCPDCGRSFTRPNQRHRCGTGDVSSILKNRPEELISVYRNLEAFIQGLGGVEIVARDRYALFRTKKIFTDISVMKDCIRIAIHLPKPESEEFFIKVVSDRKHHSHITKLYTDIDLERVKNYITEAFNFSKI